MILLIDNYDSFSYNLYQLFLSHGEEVTVKRNNEISTDDAGAIGPDAIILSPGPGRPEVKAMMFLNLPRVSGVIRIFRLQ